MDNAQTGAGLERFVAVAIGSPDEWRHIIVAFLRDHVERSGADGVVVGLSGGIDSALTAALAVDALGADKVLGVCLPHRDSDPEDLRLGQLVGDHLGIAHVQHDISPIVDGFLQAMEADGMVLGNAKARARMMALYGEAQKRGRLVCGTGNKSELLVGYFTKHGDGGVDLEPIGDLYKTQVWELSKVLGLPDEVVHRTPTAGLLAGQSDEEELGMSYEALDRILKGIELNSPLEDIARRTGASMEHVRHVDRLVRRSEHKRHAPLVAKVGARTVGIDWRRSVHWDA